MADQKKKKKSRVGNWFRRWMFGPQKELNFLEEEQVTSPFRSAVKRFFRDKISLTGLIVFLACLALVVIGPRFLPLDLSYSDATQQNIPPSMNLASIPKGLLGNIKDISVGPTYGIGCDNDGKVYTWGYTKISQTIDIKNIPEEVQNTKITQVAAGFDHVVAADEDGQIYVWGNNRLGQDEIPIKAQGEDIVQVGASQQFSAVLTAEGKMYMWGNSGNADCKVKKDFQGHIKKFALTDTAYVCLMDDGSVQYTGSKSNAFSNVPEGLDRDVVDISSTSATVAALKSDGSVVFWGNIQDGENEIPEHTGKIVSLSGGRYHYTAFMDNGEVLAWGNDHFGQADVPKSISNGSEAVTTLYTGYYQNYAITADNKAITWGLKGYLMGTDDLGRDVFTRLVNGGRVTMTVGAVAVIITTILGLLIGGISGYFGGWIDIVLMRVAEVISGIPFLPFALILSSIIPSTFSITQRMYIIMVVLGVLSWPSLARLVRAQILQVREQEYVMAAKAMGVKEYAIIFRHILPNILSVVLVEITLAFARCMLTESSLSYLGFGIIPPTPTWGNMLTGANNSVVIQQYWWRWLFPAIIFGICTIAINLMGDGLRDALDPRSEDR